MVARSLLAALAAAVLFIGLTVSAFAWAGPVEGEPPTSPDSPIGYYIWQDESGIHLRTHGTSAGQVFTARLSTNGVFQNVDAVRLERHDDFAVVDGGHTLLIRFHTYEGFDGLNFTVRGGTGLRFALRLDGELIATDNIYLGATGKHPASNPFTIRR